MPAQQTFVIDTTNSKNAQLRSLSLQSVKLADAFWEPRRTLNRTVTLHSQYEKLEESKCLDNFRRASGRKTGIDFVGWYFSDSDLYKWIEAVSASLATHPDADLEAKLDSAIDELGAAQQPDGYLNTYFMFEKEKDRWTDLHVLHEMYCAGHLFQAAVMHYRATGKTSLLNIACRLADHINALFGPSGKLGACGHPEAELALVELYRATGNETYLTLAERTIEARGQSPTAIYGKGDNRRYLQDHVPYKELKEVTGHAVRMLYLAAGAADVTMEKDSPDILNAQLAQWENFTEKRMYVNGAAGARHEGESFGADYELPSDRAYAETCAAIASVMWNQRLLLQTADPKYADLIENTLYNAVLPGISLSGTEYFYVNPLEDSGSHRRQAWFGCACCPPNIARLLAQLPSYIASTSDDETLWIHQYIAGEVDGIKVETNYPWDGKITLTNTGETPRTLKLRVPNWANGATIEGLLATTGTYHTLNLAAGEASLLNVPMPTRYVYPHQYLTNLTERVAVFRGPLLYCVEEVDHKKGDIHPLFLPTQPTGLEPKNTVLFPQLAGCVALIGQGIQVSVHQTGLYTTRVTGEESEVAPLTLIPYFAWANREPGQMQVWMRFS